MAYYRSGTQKPLEAGNGIDITDETISLKQASTTEFGAAKIDGTSISVNASGQIKKLKTQTVTLSANTSEITAGSTDVITATASAGGTLSVSSSDSSVATASVSNGEVIITGVAVGNCVITVTAAATGDYGVGTATIDTTVTVVSIYGAEWDGSSSPTWTRTDGAVNFTDPNPYYSGMSGTPSSPFDNIMPWSGMRIVEDSSAGTLVEIPKFWYKWTRDGTYMKLQISNIEQTDPDWYVSPAHADRGDNIGERDYIYVGRYHCSGTNSSPFVAPTYKSTTGLPVQSGETRDGFRSNIHNLGSNVWQWDYATLITIWMLYLIEFANWNSQAMIGYGGGANSSKSNMGYTDSMPYHTGTTMSSRTTSGYGTQYRYIEGLWDNVYDFVDGITFSYSSSSINRGVFVYVTRTPNKFSDSTGNMSYAGKLSTINLSGPIKAWYNDSSLSWVMYPSATEGNASLDTYSCDRCDYSSSSVVLSVGGMYLPSTSDGLFRLRSLEKTSDSYTGSRLMVLPPGRLSPPTN